MTTSDGPMHLVLGASGFLGSHVVRDLIERGEHVRALVRPTSDIRALADLDVDLRHGDVHNADSIRAAMAGVDVVYHCVVDARPWLRDPARLNRTNLEGLQTVLDVALEHDLLRFVYTSSVGTLPIARRPGEVIDEDSGPHNWLDTGGAYIRSRVDGENLVLAYARDHELPAVAMCVANTYGPGDLLPTPHGEFVKQAARGNLAWYVPEAAAEVVDVRDAARALVLAGERGHTGERYIVSESFIPTRELHDIAADTTGAPRARYAVPARLLGAAGLLGEAAAAVTRRDIRLTRTSIRLMHTMTALDHGKAVRDLGWHPRPIAESIRDAAQFFTSPRPAQEITP